MEEQQGLQVCRACLGGEGGFVFACFGGVAFAPPFYAREVADVCLGFCGGVADYDFVVLRDGDLGLVNIDVVGGEAGKRDGCVGCSGDVEECWNPFYTISSESECFDNFCTYSKMRSR